MLANANENENGRERKGEVCVLGRRRMEGENGTVQRGPRRTDAWASGRNEFGGRTNEQVVIYDMTPLRR